MPKADARRSSLALPTMALAIPPPLSPTGVGKCVRKAQLRELPPFQRRYPRMKNKTPTVASAQTPVRLNMK
jgi:hypothetical protein